MVPSDYRLDSVAIKLVERLEGSRRTFVGRSDEAREEFRRIALEHAEAAITEYESVALADDAGAHADFLRRELVETLVPRFHRVAIEMNAMEERGFGMGPLARPMGRLGLGAGTLLLLAMVLKFSLWNPVMWPLMMLILAIPFVPDIVSALYRRRYKQSCVSIIEDLGRIQEQASAYLTADQLNLDAPKEKQRKRPRPPQGEIQ